MDDDLRTITLDIRTLTLGELAEIERQSGRDATALLVAGRATRRLVALFVHELRSSEKPRSWQELANLRLLDGQSSMSPPSPAGRRQRRRSSRSQTSPT